MLGYVVKYSISSPFSYGDYRASIIGPSISRGFMDRAVERSKEDIVRLTNQIRLEPAIARQTECLCTKVLPSAIETNDQSLREAANVVRSRE